MNAQVPDNSEQHNTLESAAHTLGVSVQTIKKWIRQDNIQKTVLDNDKRRVYITHNDVIALAHKHRPLTIKKLDQQKSTHQLTGLYSLADIQRLLGVTKSTLDNWLAHTDIEKKVIVTDKKRVYISYSDILKLAEKYNHTIAYDTATQEQNDHPQADTQDNSQTQANNHAHGKKLYTIAEAALFLGVTDNTVKQWLSRYNIPKHTLETDKTRIYIAYSDLIQLANKQNRKRAYPITISSDIKEIRYRMENMDASLLKLLEHIKSAKYPPQ